MKTPTKQRISKIALLTCLLTLAGCATGQDTRQASSPVKAEEKAAQLVGYCQRLQQEGDLANAAGFCDRALEYDPTNKVALLSLARILEERRAPREAAQAYRAILVLEPDNAEARYGLGKTYVALEQYKLAREQLELALQTGSDPRVYNTLGVVHDQLGDHAAAQEVYRRGLSSDSDNVPLRTNLGLSMVLSGQHAPGLQLLREVSALPDAGPDTRQVLAFAYAIAGDMAAAEETALIDLPQDVARANLAYYEGLREAGVGDPPPPPPTPSLAEAMPVDDMPMADPAMAEMPALPLFDPEVATAIALSDAEAAQRPWTEWGQLPDYSKTVAQLNALHGDREEAPQQPWSLANQSPAEGQQLAMAETGASDVPAMSADIDSAALPEAGNDDPYLSSLEKLLAELPPEDGGTQGGMMESMEAEAIPGMQEPAMASEPMMAPGPQMAGNTEAEPAMAPATPPKKPEMQMAESKPMAAAMAPSMAKSGSFYAVQLGSYRSPEQAAKGWMQLQANANDLLGSMDPVFTKADLGAEKGIFYRLRTQPNARASAKELCGELSKRGIDCLVVKSEAPQQEVTSG